MVVSKEKMEVGSGKSKALRVGDCPEIENVPYKWLLQECSKQTPISGEILKVKTMESCSGSSSLFCRMLSIKS